MLKLFRCCALAAAICLAASASVSGLTPGTTYHFRMVAVSDAGTRYGLDMTFTTT